MIPFRILTAGIAIGLPVPADWRSIQSLPLLIFVGVTGVGKSTTLEHVMRSIASSLLPDRRLLTDDLIIAEMQQIDHEQTGAPLGPVKDRKLRFEYTRRYRELYPGGMAQALSQLLIQPTELPNILIFDGLRGDNEVRCAAELLPQARFVMLDAPDVVRVQRLLGRSDAFDQIAVSASTSNQALTSFASLGVAEASDLFTVREEQILLNLVRSGTVSSDDLRAKLQIVVEERRNYDPLSTRLALLARASERSLIIDTTEHDAKQVSELVVQQVQQWWRL